MKGAIEYTLDEALRNQEPRRPGMVALFQKMQAEQPKRDPWAVMADAKRDYTERGIRA